MCLRAHGKGEGSTSCVCLLAVYGGAYCTCADKLSHLCTNKRNNVQNGDRHVSGNVGDRVNPVNVGYGLAVCLNCELISPSFALLVALKDIYGEGEAAALVNLNGRAANEVYLVANGRFGKNYVVDIEICGDLDDLGITVCALVCVCLIDVNGLAGPLGFNFNSFRNVFVKEVVDFFRADNNGVLNTLAVFLFESGKVA